MDSTFRLMGGGPEGSIGATWSGRSASSPASRSCCCWQTAASRERSFHFPLRPIGPKFFSAASPALLILAAVGIANTYPGRSEACAATRKRTHLALPRAAFSSRMAIAVPVLIAIAVGVVMTFLATRTRFGRYVYAIGGNPEAAELAGVNTRWVIVMIFMLMGLLAAVGGAVSIARLNAATNAARHARRTAGHRGRGDRRNVAGGRRRHRSGAMLGARAHAVAPIGHGSARRRHAAPKHRRWRRPGARRLARHRSIGAACK